MEDRLTLRIDAALIENTKVYAKESGETLSQIVANYFKLLTGETKVDSVPMTPRVKSLRGILAGSGLSEEDYYKHLEEKYL